MIDIEKREQPDITGPTQPHDKIRHQIRMSIFQRIGLLTDALLEHFYGLDMDEVRSKQKSKNFSDRDNTGG